MFDWLKKLSLQKYIMSAVRKLLAILGGYLIAKLGLDEGVVNAFINSTVDFLAALAPIVIAFLWSWYDKAKK